VEAVHPLAGSATSVPCRRGFIASLLVALLLPACGADPGDGAPILRVWAHAGDEAEREVLEGQVARFNAGDRGIQVDLTLLPEGSYNAQVQAAAVAGDLPDVLEFDGPFLYSYVWQGHLVPLDELLGPEVRADLLGSIIDQGTYRDRLYAVGTFDSGLGLYARRSHLESIGARIPAGPGDAWSGDEFDQLLHDLARLDPDGAVLDLKLNYAGEWYTYGISPLVQSAGGDLIDRESLSHASGVLDGPASVRAMTRIQEWIHSGLVDPNIDDAGFASGRVALSLGGHWNYAAYSNAAGSDLALVPLPDLGAGAKTGRGSWVWALTRYCERPDEAVAFLEFLLQPAEILEMTRANGAVPASYRAVAQSELYAAGGPLELFATQLREGYAIGRPPTPAYPIITAEFQEAFDRIRSGGDVAEVLARAARTIDEEIQDNRGYPE
jgi:multiple sugar transport system substrate-binding protein